MPCESKATPGGSVGADTGAYVYVGVYEGADAGTGCVKVDWRCGGGERQRSPPSGADADCEMGGGADGDTAALDVLVVELICAGVGVARGITVGGGGLRNLNGSSVGSEVMSACSSVITRSTGGDVIDAATGDIGGGTDTTNASLVTCSGGDVGAEGRAATAAGVGVPSVASGFRSPRGNDTVKTSSPSSVPVSRAGVRARGGGGCAEARTITSGRIPESLTRYVGPCPGRGRREGSEYRNRSCCFVHGRSGLIRNQVRGVIEDGDSAERVELRGENRPLPEPRPRAAKPTLGPRLLPLDVWDWSCRCKRCSSRRFNSSNPSCVH